MSKDRDNTMGINSRKSNEYFYTKNIENTLYRCDLNNEQNQCKGNVRSLVLFQPGGLMVKIWQRHLFIEPSYTNICTPL